MDAEPLKRPLSAMSEEAEIRGRFEE